MAKISTYPDTPPPALDDFLLGTDVSNDNATQNFLVSDLINLIRPYKVYTALLTQSGENAPVPTILQNTIGNISWEYLEPGVYFATSDGLFTLNKTIIFPGNAQTSIGVSYPASINAIELDMNNPIARQDDELFNTPFEIRVYN